MESNNIFKVVWLGKMRGLNWYRVWTRVLGGKLAVLFVSYEEYYSPDLYCLGMLCGAEAFSSESLKTVDCICRINFKKFVTRTSCRVEKRTVLLP